MNMKHSITKIFASILILFGAVDSAIPEETLFFFSQGFESDVLIPNSNWSSETLGIGSSVQTSGGIASLTQQYDQNNASFQPKFSKLKYRFLYPSPRSPWKITAALNWETNGIDHGNAEKRLTLYSATMSPMFSIGITGSTKTGDYCTVFLWQTPSGSDKITDQKFNIDGAAWANFSIEYDPQSGYAELKINDAKIFHGFTKPDLSTTSLEVSNYAPGDAYNAGNLRVDKISAERTTPTAGVLHGIPKGNFDSNPFNLDFGGQWTTYTNWDPTTTAKHVFQANDLTNGIVELTNNWLSQTSRITYTDLKTTPINTSWKISADLKGTYTNQSRSDVLFLSDAGNIRVFYLDIQGKSDPISNKYSSIRWKAGSIEGQIVDAAELGTDFFKKVSIEYNPISGQATGRIGTTQIFNVFAEKNIAVKSISVENNTNSSTWDPGTLFVDNIKSEVIPDLSSNTILSGFPGGAFDLIGNNATWQFGSGWWQGHSTTTGNPSWDNLSAAVASGTGASRHVQLIQNWVDHFAEITYHDLYSTPIDQSWRISADLKSSHSQNTTSSRTDSMVLLDKNGKRVLALGFTNNSVLWRFFDLNNGNVVQSETIANSSLSNSAYQRFSITYNPLSGEVFVFREGKSIFSSLVDVGLQISKVKFTNRADFGTWDPGIFYIDNVSSIPEQNQFPRYRGFSSKSLDLDSLTKIKSLYGANQIRYVLTPRYEARNAGAQNSFPYWDNYISTLKNGLENARKLGLHVVVNLHQIPDADISTQDSRPIWSNPIAREQFHLCWRQITEITRQTRQPIWLELFNEPNTDPNKPTNIDRDQAEWSALAQTSIDHIRGQNNPLPENNNYDHVFEDKIHPIVFCSGPGDYSKGLRFWPIMQDIYQNVIYTTHQWQSDDYSLYGSSAEHPLTGNPLPRPSKASIRERLKNTRDFENFFGHKIWIGEFGAYQYTPESDAWTSDHIELFEEYGWDWSFWMWSDDFFPGFGFTGSARTALGEKLYRGMRLNR